MTTLNMKEMNQVSGGNASTEASASKDQNPLTGGADNILAGVPPMVAGVPPMVAAV